MEKLDDEVFVFVPSRGNFKLIKRCLLSYSKVFSHSFEGKSNFIIVNDSSNKDLSTDINSIQGIPSNINVFYVTKSNISSFLSNLSISDQLIKLYFSGILNKLGEECWSPSRPRNWILLLVLLLTNDDNPIIFLDDDILFNDFQIDNYKFNVDGVNVIQELINNNNGNTKAIGAKYLGHADTSRFDKLLNLITYPSYLNYINQNGDLSSSRYNLSIIDNGIHDLEKIYDGPASLSTGLLLVKKALCEKYFFPPFYNEDWFWLFLNQNKENDFVLIKNRVGHSPFNSLIINTIGMEYRTLEEEKGELLFDLLKTKRSHSEGLENIEVLNSISILELERAKTERRLKYEELIQLAKDKIKTGKSNINHNSYTKILKDLDAGKDILEKISVKEIHTILTSYIENIKTWREFSNIINKLNSFETMKIFLIHCKII